MRNLLYFFVRHAAWFIYIFYAAISLVLLFKYNSYQHSIFFSSSNAVAGQVYEITGNVKAYFNLRNINEDLLERNGYLEMELHRLRAQQKIAEGDSLNKRLPADSILNSYEMQVAHVINNSVTRINNYITIDKGAKDGIRPEMGVLDQNGVVGIVDRVSDHYAVVISLLNPKLRLSCKVKGNDYFGSLVWNGENSQYAILEELPRHVKFNKGDTILTSGYSAVFPDGIMVGEVVDYQQQRNDNFYALKVKLFTDFARLSNVRIISSQQQSEINQIEKQPIKNE